jgi:hypothetical protein
MIYVILVKAFISSAEAGRRALQLDKNNEKNHHQRTRYAFGPSSVIKTAKRFRFLFLSVYRRVIRRVILFPS